MKSRPPSVALAVALSGLLCSATHAAESAPRAWSERLDVADADVAALAVPRVDRSALLAADEAAVAAKAGQPATKRMRIARGDTVSARPDRDGTWQDTADGGRLWRLRVDAPDATDLQVGFTRVQLPEGATFAVYSTSERYAAGPYLAADVNPHGQLWSAMVPGDEAIVELYLPPGSGEHVFEVGYVGAGYRDFTGRDGGLVPMGGSGACNINVACPLGDPYRDQIRSVAHYSFVDGGTWICTGSLVANTAGDTTPLFLTAAHCLDTNAMAATMTFYWNYQSSTCSGNTGVSMGQNQSGAQLRMSRANVDTTLVQLNAVPQASFNVYYSGWDATGSTPGGIIGIHHPSGDAKKITEDANGISSMTNCIVSGSTGQTHWRTGAPYTQGTTEGGSSGSGIWIPSNDGGGGAKLLIGVLSGGDAACSDSNPTQPNTGYDCYGKLSAAFDGTAANQRLKDWLDPGNTGSLRQQGRDSQSTDIVFRNGFE